ncbi:LexA family transcriptional regulator [Dolosigranulum pigrum]|uniref:LexA family protein n=1 Tax=Dolosigranulum pigrum TaxID=29394 RepID=UPI001AD896B3|nr:LexA family transcriptional regulator [Dolosigranulum pigrum]QTJ49173.1 LexA family transcriptional regulator [Dolosigranulum pigrum]
MTTLANNIKYYRKLNSLTQKDLADKLKIKPTAISAWELGRNKPLMDNVEKMASLFDVSKSQLLGDDFEPTNTDAVSTPFVKIPVIGVIACGEPIDAEENISEYRSVPADRLPNGDVFYLRAKGDSMEPKIPDGSYVLCRKQSDVENGEIAAVLVNGDEEATLKRVVKQGDIVLLQALNENYAPYILNADNPGKIVGKAIRMETEL